MDGFIDQLVRRYAARADAQVALRTRVQEALPEMVRVLVAEFGATRVILFGSMAGDTLWDEPDIDLLVAGIDPALLGRAAGRLFLLAPLLVDLVPIETGRREVVERGLLAGIVLYSN